MHRGKASVLARPQLALIHIYAHAAAISEEQRRGIMMEEAGCSSSTMLDQAGFERVMAALERTLWERVDAHMALDPRLCSVCGRRLIMQGKKGRCPEGCEERCVAAWSRDYWQRKVPHAGRANSRELHKLMGLWHLLCDSLPLEKRADRYLAAIIVKACETGAEPAQRIAALLDPAGFLQPSNIRQTECLAAIEALKDRLAYVSH